MAKKTDYLASIRVLSADEMKAKIKEDELRLKKVFFAHSVASIENPTSIRLLKKDIARLKTELRKKELGF